jgi:phosphate-selective porin OprO/OprP
VKALEDALATKADDDAATKTRLSTLEQQFADTVWTFDNGRPQVQSADGRFLMALRYRLQFDTVLFDQRSNINATNAQFKDLNSGAAVRRFYIGAEGRAFRDFWYELRLDFGGSNFETTNPIVNLGRVAYNWGNLAYANQPHFRINAGILQPIFTYGDSVSSGSTTFLERADVVNLATAAYGAQDPRRGIELTFQESDIFSPGDNLVISGAFTGASGAANPPAAFANTDEGTQVIGRAVYRLWSDGFSNVQVGGSGSRILSLTGAAAPGGVRSISLQDRPEVRGDGNRLVSTASSTLIGTNAGVTSNIPENGGWLWGLEFGSNWQNFYLAGEYMKFGMDRETGCGANCQVFGAAPGVNPGDPEFSGWYVEGSWILTGETKTYSPLATNNEYATFNNPRVITPFDWNGGTWGAWELAARYSDLDLNWHEGTIGQTMAASPIGGVRGGEQKIVTLGLNWYLNNNVLLRLNYLIAEVNKLGFVTSNGSTTLQKIGQDFNAFALRLQYTN